MIKFEEFNPDPYTGIKISDGKKTIEYLAVQLYDEIIYYVERKKPETIEQACEYIEEFEKMNLVERLRALWEQK